MTQGGGEVACQQHVRPLQARNARRTFCVDILAVLLLLPLRQKKKALMPACCETSTRRYIHSYGWAATLRGTADWAPDAVGLSAAPRAAWAAAPGTGGGEAGGVAVPGGCAWEQKEEGVIQKGGGPQQGHFRRQEQAARTTPDPSCCLASGPPTHR